MHLKLPIFTHYNKTKCTLPEMQPFSEYILLYTTNTTKDYCTMASFN